VRLSRFIQNEGQKQIPHGLKPFGMTEKQIPDGELLGSQALKVVEGIALVIVVDALSQRFKSKSQELWLEARS